MAANAIPTGIQSTYQAQPTQRQFYEVTKNSDKMGALTEIFNKILVPLYGPQEKALSQIAAAEDRTCYLLCEGKDPVGVIVFKKVLSNEYAAHGVRESIEIKSLFVVDSGNNSGRGLGTTLLNKVAEEVNKLQLNHKSFHVTVSATKQESLIFFLTRGFTIKGKWKDRYMPGTTEFLLYCVANDILKTPEDLAANKTSSVSQKLIEVNKTSGKDEMVPALVQKGLAPQFIGYVDAHWHDIHSLRLLPDGTIASGSKDNTLRKWDQKGTLLKVIRDVEPRGIEEKNWITAIGVLNDEYWISGDRSGLIHLWTTSGNFVREIKPKLPGKEHISHEYNKRRVNCLAAAVNKQKLGFFIGFPTIFDEYNVIEGRTVASTKMSDNDWVYCIHPLEESRLLTVTGGSLEIVQKYDGLWKRTKTLIQEPRRTGKTRQHISSLTALESSKLFGLGLFGGFVKVLDLEKEKVVNEWKDHKDNVWAIENITRDIFASSSDDRSIKLWDVRMKEGKVHDIENHIGGVSALLRINDSVLVAGTCSKDPIEREPGRLMFYDIRK